MVSAVSLGEHPGCPNSRAAWCWSLTRRALCRAFAAAATRVGVRDVNVDGARALAQKVGELAIEGDVADPASYERAVAAVIGRFGDGRDPRGSHDETGDHRQRDRKSVV